MHTRGTADGDRWADLVAAVRVDLDDMVAEFLNKVTEVPPYAQGLVPPGRLREDAVASYDFLSRQLGGLAVSDDLQRIGPEIGRDRATRGVPLNELMNAVRLDFQVMWNALRARATAKDMALLVRQAEHVWSVVEQYTTTIQASYLAHRSTLAAERHRERSVTVADLLARDVPDPMQVIRVARALGVEPEAPVLVAAALVGEDRSLRAAADQLGASGTPVHVQDRGRHTVLLAHPRSDSGSIDAQRFLSSTRCVVAPLAERLEQVPGSVRLAEEMADVLPTGAAGPQQIRDLWTEMVRHRVADLLPALSAEALSGLLDARAGERQRLLETVREYAASGSVHDTAAALYCHRNTVVNRLRRFAELTGYDVTIPREAALVLLLGGPTMTPH